ncbi:hypothetical protein GBA52_027466, partial [Prunus armeniaca]
PPPLLTKQRGFLSSIVSQEQINKSSTILKRKKILIVPCGWFGFCIIAQLKNKWSIDSMTDQHKSQTDRLGLWLSIWCAHKGSLHSCPRGRPWSPQPNFRHSKGSLDPSYPIVCPPLLMATTV